MTVAFQMVTKAISIKLQQYQILVIFQARSFLETIVQEVLNLSFQPKNPLSNGSL